ncbi:MAG: PhoX family protein [Ferrovibrio sp.]|uniref:PhoX family protein n=1 Tax=Ferrovibrio sp. TaxID=1917215 RepID=UPI00391AE2E1
MTSPTFDGRSRSEAFEDSQDIGINDSPNPTISEVVRQRYGRRDVLKGLLAGSAAGIALGSGLPLAASAAAQNSPRASTGGFTFTEISHGVDGRHHVAPGYDADILIRWGDPVTSDAPAFNVRAQSAAAQAKQFGYNNDFIGYMPLPLGSRNSDRGLLFVNHEYTSEEVMFPGIGRQDSKDKLFKDMTRPLVEIEMAAHGASIIEVQKNADGKWSLVGGSPYARRIDALSSVCEITGPAAGHARLKTKADPSGRRVIGMLNNCAGGLTPWGTVLTAEENFHGYFGGKLEAGHPEERNHKRYEVPGNWYNWGQYYDRFDVAKEPNEANRFGWMVEVDPYDPRSVPKKRTALGRFKHEGAAVVLNSDGRVVLYSGDDERFEYVYKFVTAKRFNPNDRRANLNLLDEGTLYVARYNADGSADWLPLVHGQGPLTAANGFNSQADILIETRRAADLLGATKMDRPEDIEAHPANGRVYVMLTNNTRRKADQVDAANPRASNEWGQVVEMQVSNGDHAGAKCQWTLLLQAGNPADPRVAGKFHPATSKNGWFACPDNAAIDPQGRLWITTDQGEAWEKASGTADGVWAVETEGPNRGLSKMFFRVPVGAEMCGPCFTPDGKTLFVAVQHPATDGGEKFTKSGKGSTFEDPATRWPDFLPDMPPRPSVVVITKTDGGLIGS